MEDIILDLWFFFICEIGGILIESMIVYVLIIIVMVNI